MKLLAIFVAACIALNVYVLSQLEEQSAALHNFEISPQAQKPTAINNTNNEENEAVAFLKMEVTALHSRLQAVEQAYAVLNVAQEDIPNIPEHASNTDSLIDSIQSASNSGTEEEWFWSQESTDNDVSMSFEQTEEFSVTSVVCRADWCRVEVEYTGDETNDLISGLELQLKINESLGRNTVIQSGARNGRNRVLFIQ